MLQHPEVDHDLLAPPDLVRHVPEYHQVEPADALALITENEAEAFGEVHGILYLDMTADERRLETWHNLAHDATEDDGISHGSDACAVCRRLTAAIRAAGQLNRGAH
jgi:hypothetical protein